MSSHKTGQEQRPDPHHCRPASVISVQSIWSWLLLLAVLFRPHLGYVAALQEAYNTNVFTKKDPETRADILCTRLQIAFRVLLVSIGILGLRRFGDRPSLSFPTDRKRIVPGQV